MYENRCTDTKVWGVCVCVSVCFYVFTWTREPQWPRLRSPGCWRWKWWCWTPWRARFCRWIALRDTWCRSAHAFAFWMQVDCVTSARALGWEKEPEVVRPGLLLVWTAGSGSNALERNTSRWMHQLWEAAFINTCYVVGFSCRLTFYHFPCLQLCLHEEQRLLDGCEPVNPGFQL